MFSDEPEIFIKSNRPADGYDFGGYPGLPDDKYKVNLNINRIK